MRKLILVLSFAALVSAAGYSQDRSDSTSTGKRTETSKGRTKILIEELPEPVKQALEDEAFKGWMINSAFRDSRNEQYEVELKNGVDRQVVKFNKEGKRLSR